MGPRWESFQGADGRHGAGAARFQAVGLKTPQRHKCAASLLLSNTLQSRSVRRRNGVPMNFFCGGRGMKWSRTTGRSAGRRERRDRRTREAGRSPDLRWLLVPNSSECSSVCPALLAVLHFFYPFFPRFYRNPAARSDRPSPRPPPIALRLPTIVANISPSLNGPLRSPGARVHALSTRASPWGAARPRLGPA